MRIALTGATGLLGRNLLFEIIKQNLNNLDDLEILVLGRPQKTSPLDERLENILDNDGFDYVDVDSKSRPALKNELLANRIIPIPFDLTHDELGISPDDFKTLKNKKIDLFFHIAALTDFRSNSAVKAKLEEVNVKGTQRVLRLIEGLNVGQLIYTGSAYSCGSKTGVVEPDYINLNEKFRNPYEETKLRAEILVKEFAKNHKMKFKVFRPSTICGRLIEKPIGSINKFDVFYAWGAFFLRLKIKYLKTIDNIYNVSYQIPIRIHFNPNSGLNIIPSDYAAKVLYHVSFDNWKSDNFYLANSKETPHKLYVSLMLEQLKIEGCSFMAEEPQDKNEIEKFYYKTMGRLFTPYATTESIIFDTSNLKENLKKNNLTCPTIDRENLIKLIDFAKNRYFNLEVESADFK